MARLVTEVGASASTLMVKPIVALAPTASTALLLHSTTPAAWLQLKPPVVVKPLSKLMPSGSTSTMRIGSLVGAEPRLVRVSVYWPLPPASSGPALDLLSARNGASTMSMSIAQPGATLLSIQAPVLPGVGTGLSGSPPPPTRPRLMMALPEGASTIAVKLNTLAPPAGITTGLVQVSTSLAALQLQSPPCGPASGTAPSAMESWAGNTSTTVIVPVVGTSDWLPTVSAYVVAPEVSSTSLPLVLVSTRSGWHWAPGGTPGVSGAMNVATPPLWPNEP